MTIRLTRLTALEIVDSRARPTLQVTATLASGAQAGAGVPSGASTGTREAVERRDGDPGRYAGQGVLGAVDAVNGELADALVGRDFADLAALDQVMIELDGTPTKARLGANAIVGVSMAAARAMATDAREPLHEWLAPTDVTARLPVPHFNVINGGAHAHNGLDFQEFMLAPLGAPDYAEAVRAGVETYNVLRTLLHERGLGTGLGDEGGFAPDLTRPDEALELLVEAIDRAGYRAGRDGIAIALDPAASEFHRDGTYHVAGQRLSTGDLIGLYADLVDRFPIWSIEDGLTEDDWDGWQQLTARLGERIQVVGDDIFVTSPTIIGRAIDDGVANAALIKVNQIGTVTETLKAMRICRDADYAQMVSHRSGETPDDFIADLTVATGCGQLKSGAPARGERVAKYNRLTVIAASRQLEYGLTG